ncbi:hypothetical protein HOLleu_25823 [Holothuria leucospilota]|uniref:Uncharacterized protein n=1 Tax=Holothuria leucospilota TaxID=206669 RepID=A0A9Q1H4M5_HOLLE|nr:hypothetical protein HOLleu_25823 [Holothuria leucospilota]
MASSILSFENDWYAVQCIPDICTAASNLMEDLKKDFPELATLTDDVTVNYKRYSFGKRSVTKISYQVRNNITINNPYMFVYGMTLSVDGKIVISGITSNEQSSFIIVIDMVGKLFKKRKLNTGKYSYPRYCKFSSQHKVASVCQPNETGLFDVRNGAYVKKNISDVINSWSKDRFVSCVDTDPVNNHMLVAGFNRRDVYVFDDQLKYLYILTLPETIKWPRDITVNDYHLLVCDYENEKCHLTTMDRLESKLVGEYMKPDLDGNDCTPISVCTGRAGFVYILWKTY